MALETDTGARQSSTTMNRRESPSEAGASGTERGLSRPRRPITMIIDELNHRGSRASSSRGKHD